MKDTEREIELIDYIEIVLKWKWLIAGATIAGLAGGWFFRANPPPTQYKAAVLLMVKPRASVSSKDTEVAPSALSSQFYKSLALADDLKQALIDSLDLGGRVSSIDGHLNVENVDQTGIRLEVESIDAGLAIKMVNAWAEMFLERNRGLGSEAVKSFFDYVSNQYERSRELLGAAEDSLKIFEASNEVRALELQQSILDTTRNVLQSDLIVLQLEKQEDQAELENAEEQIDSFEIDGQPLSFSIISALRDSASWPAPSLARSVIASMVQLDSYQRSLHELEEQHELRLVEFNQQYGYENLEQQIAGQDSLVRFDRSRLAQHTSAHLFLQRTIDDLEARLKRRSPTLSLTADRATPNPAYIKIAQDIDSVRVVLDLASGQAPEALLLELRRSEANLIRLLKLYYPLRREKEEFLGQFTQERRDLKRHLSSLRKSYDVIVSGHLASRGKVATLRPRLQGLQDKIKSKKKVLTQMQGRLRSIEKQLSLLLSRRDRLTRSRETYQGTYARFSHLLEETRIAREKAAGDIQILTRAIEARIVPQESPKQKAAISGGVALIVSTFVVFLLEYVRKARLARAGSDPAT
jgi:uncharacterized protein involved in exopolysaccharide biosynthesis